MKKNLRSVLIYSFILTVLIGFSSCSKDDDKDSTPDPTTVLNSKTWKVSTYDAQNGDMVSQLAAEIYAVFEPAEYKFQTGGVLTYFDSFGFSETGTWALATDNKTLTLKDSEGDVFAIAEITEAKTSSLKWKVTYKKADLQTTSDVTMLFVLIPKA